MSAVNAEEEHTGILILLIEPLHIRHFFLTGAAPGFPDIHDNKPFPLHDGIIHRVAVKIRRYKAQLSRATSLCLSAARKASGRQRFNDSSGSFFGKGFLDRDVRIFALTGRECFADIIIHIFIQIAILIGHVQPSGILGEIQHYIFAVDVIIEKHIIQSFKFIQQSSIGDVIVSDASVPGDIGHIYIIKFFRFVFRITVFDPRHGIAHGRRIVIEIPDRLFFRASGFQNHRHVIVLWIVIIGFPFKNVVIFLPLLFITGVRFNTQAAIST